MIEHRILTRYLSVSAMLAVLLFATVHPALAQLSAKGGAVAIDSDGLELFDDRREAVFSGKVDAIQDDVRLRADELRVVYDKVIADANSNNPLGDGWGDMRTIIATGNVYYVTPKQVAKAEKAVYDVAKDQVTMTGNVVVTQEKNVIRGDRLVLAISTGRAIFDAPTTQNETSGRVRAVFFPRAKEEDATASEEQSTATVSGGVGQ